MTTQPKVILIVFASALALMLPAAAQADVLVEAPETNAVCGDAIHVGVWAQPGTPIPERAVLITARDRRTGIVWWSRAVTARTTRWRHWQLPSGLHGQCGTTVITYVLAAGPSDRSVVRFRSEGV
jgi:hypothetical protein